MPRTSRDLFCEKPGPSSYVEDMVARTYSQVSNQNAAMGVLPVSAVVVNLGKLRCVEGEADHASLSCTSDARETPVRSRSTPDALDAL